MRSISHLNAPLRPAIQSRGSCGLYSRAFRSDTRLRPLRGVKLGQLTSNSRDCQDISESCGGKSANGHFRNGQDRGPGRPLPNSRDREDGRVEGGIGRSAQSGAQSRALAQDEGQKWHPSATSIAGGGREGEGEVGAESATYFDKIVEDARKSPRPAKMPRRFRGYRVGGRTSEFEEVFASAREHPRDDKNRLHVIRRPMFVIEKRPLRPEDLNQRDDSQRDDDWRRILDLLNQFSPVEADKDKLVAQVADHFVISLDQIDRDSATIERTDNAYWKGQDDMDDLEIEELEDAVGVITYAPPRSPMPIRAYLTHGKRPQRRPNIRNALTFAVYVNDLTDPSLQLDKYGGSSDGAAAASIDRHNEAVTTELVSIFTDRRLQSHITAEALDRALLCLVRYGDIRSVRIIILILRRRSFAFTAASFNVLLSAVAEHGSIPKFLYFLRIMLRQGLQPTAETWSALHALGSCTGNELPADLEEGKVSKEMMRRAADKRTKSGAASGLAPVRRHIVA